MIYPCTECGECCRHIGAVPELSGFHSGDGICIHLLDDGKCGIYNDRPLVCRIDEGYEKLFSADISLSDYYSINAKVCNELQQVAGLSQSLRIRLIDSKF